MEIVNTLYIFSAHKVLKEKLDLNSDFENKTDIDCQGKPTNKNFNENELAAITELCVSQMTTIDNVKVYDRVKIGKEIFTSQKYVRQKKRCNYYIFWDNSCFGLVLCFLSLNNVFFALVRRLVRCNDRASRITNQKVNIDFSNFIIPIRDTYCIEVIPVQVIQGKVSKIGSYICFPPNNYEKK